MNIINKLKSYLTVATLLAMQVLVPLSQVGLVNAAGSISASDHEGQLSPSLSWTNGNVTTYSEGDFINFRLTLTASGSTTGNFMVRYDVGATCSFFTNYFSLTNVENLSGAIPTVTAFGAPTLSGSEWVQELSVAFTGVGKARANYQLKLGDTAGACNGASTHTALGNAPAARNGDFANIGSQEVSIPAKDVLVLPDIKVTKLIDEDGDNVTDRTAMLNEWFFSIDGQTQVGTDGNGVVIFANVAGGAHSITESGPDNYKFFSGSGDCKFSTQGVATLDIVVTTNTQNLACTFKNQKIQDSKITVVKEVKNDNGGNLAASDFILSINGDAVAQNQQLPYAPNVVYTVSEAPVAGYEQTGIACLDDETQQSVGHPFTPTPAQAVTCTVKNDDIPATIKLVKTVVNDNGGDAVVSQFTLNVGATTVVSGATNSFNADVYTMSELNLFGYQAGTWGGDCNFDGSLTALLGGTYECTITNDDIAPTLRVVKYANNDDGGDSQASSFELMLNGSSLGTPSTTTSDDPENGDFVSTASYNNIELNASTEYTLAEEPMKGYETTSISCFDVTNGLTGAPVIAQPFTPSVGRNYLCNVVNDDIAPKITITKVVINDDGGLLESTDFVLYLFNGDEFIEVQSGFENVVKAGDYSVLESKNMSYKFVSFSGDCELGQISAVIGSNYECTITNDDQPAYVVVDKVVINDNGGHLTNEDFQMTLNGANIDQDTFTRINANTDYTIGEIKVDGYAQTNISYTQEFSEDCNYVQGGRNLSQDIKSLAIKPKVIDSTPSDTFRALPCMVYRVTVTNDDQPVEITVNKVVINDNGSTLNPENFTLLVNGDVVKHGAVNGYAANKSYTVSEQLLNGYRQVSLVCADNNTQEVLGATFTPKLGQQVTCVITNDDDPKITVVLAETGGAPIATILLGTVLVGVALSLRKSKQELVKAVK